MDLPRRFDHGARVTRTRSLTGPTAIGLWLTAIALLLRLLVPAGYMPAAGALTLSVTICADMGDERATIVIPRNAPEDDGAATDCPYALAALDTLTPPDAPVLAAPALFAAASPAPLPAALAPGRGLAAPPPPATGPPAFL